jgi:chromosome segregation ATPase
MHFDVNEVSMTAMNRGAIFGGVIVVLALAAGSRSTAAQPQQQSGDVLPALLQEVRGLRAAMEQMATSNTHAQLLVGRLQLQESRMNSMIRRLDTVRDERAKAQTAYEHIKGSLQMLEGDHAPNDMPASDKDNVLAGLKHEMESAKAAVDRWVAEETQLTSDLTAEQARWIDINQRLDDLERSLKR